MRTADVVLRKDVPHVGKIGEVKTVSSGFARNYLIPQGLAFEATASAVRVLEEERRKESKAQAKALEEARQLQKKLERVSLTVRRSAGDEGKLFGSVTAADVAEALVHEGITIDKRAVRLEEPLKMLGVYTIPLHLHGEVDAKVKVWVVKE